MRASRPRIRTARKGRDLVAERLQEVDQERGQDHDWNDQGDLNRLDQDAVADPEGGAIARGDPSPYAGGPHQHVSEAAQGDRNGLASELRESQDRGDSRDGQILEGHDLVRLAVLDRHLEHELCRDLQRQRMKQGCDQDGWNYLDKGHRVIAAVALSVRVGSNGERNTSMKRGSCKSGSRPDPRWR